MEAPTVGVLHGAGAEVAKSLLSWVDDLSAAASDAVPRSTQPWSRDRAACRKAACPDWSLPGPDSDCHHLGAARAQDIATSAPEGVKPQKPPRTARPPASGSAVVVWHSAPPWRQRPSVGAQGRHRHLRPTRCETSERHPLLATTRLGPRPLVNDHGAAPRHSSPPPAPAPRPRHRLLARHRRPRLAPHPSPLPGPFSHQRRQLDHSASFTPHQR
jgi:hypothetical protein